jgi:hypothetical protein
MWSDGLKEEVSDELPDYMREELEVYLDELQEKSMRYKIINALDGFKNIRKAFNWQVWALHDDGRRNLCGVFQTKAKAQECINGLL